MGEIEKKEAHFVRGGGEISGKRAREVIVAQVQNEELGGEDKERRDGEGQVVEGQVEMGEGA